MSAPINVELGASASSSAAQKFAGQFGAGDVYVSTGGEKVSQTLFIVAGVAAVAVAVVVLIALFKFRR